jgi:hypothetical protein
MQKLYLAAALERAAELRVYAAELAEMGYDVTSRWLDSGMQKLAPDLCAAVDLADIERADTVISFTGGGRGGRHVEFGYGLAMRKGLVLIGTREHVFHYLPEVAHFDTWAAFKEGVCRHAS